ncbi:S1C family serine protease [Anaeromyxobacter sp. PSR-1]|uniref:S1C family serine protease n=1 Tax=Anaeromyxobacter sp. PSR-1 TaxID=1300915 RepID=UPI0005E41175|nr:S1C family serine protease [Anaeromyxobacter sp. PSR-1]GAO05460.1 putative periplasmic serine endoprotease DegP-like [Anaeromyxobacter sp. PSR-1]
MTSAPPGNTPLHPDVLAQLSARLAALTASAAAHVVRVEGRRHASASGVVWSADGVIVTAHHALERDEGVTVGLPSGDEVAAEVIGRDPSTDLAALRVRAPGLAPPDWADAAGAAAGQLTLVVTRPGRGPRAELGLLARAGEAFRAPMGGRIDRWLELGVARHPGLSGGLVLGADGLALGVAAAGLVRGAALAVPAATLGRVVASLLSHGEVRRGYLGLATQPVPLPPALRARTGEELALLVARVEPGSPADRAGVLLGDAILSVGGEALQDPGELLALLSEDRIGQAVTLRVLRAGELREVAVTVGVRGRRA